jgi:hypothetical protein
MNRRWILFLLVFTLLAAAQAALAQDDSAKPWCHQSSMVRAEQRSPYGSWTWIAVYGHGTRGIRAVYQEYNHRIILMTSDMREVVQVIEEGIDLNGFRVMSYSPDCRYMAGALGARDERIETAIWDLSTNPARRVGSVEDGIDSAHRLEWSPDSRYAMIGTRNATYLWNFGANTRVQLVADTVSTCYFGLSGCAGGMVPYRGLVWDIPNGVVRISLNRVNYGVTYDLNTGLPIDITTWDGAPVTADETQTVQDRVETTYGCVPRVQYQTYNHRLVLKDWISGELLDVIEDHLDLGGFQLLGWSATCNYIAAAIDDGTGLTLATWNVYTHARTSIPISDYVDWFYWASVGNVALVKTDGEGIFVWNIDTNQHYPQKLGADGQPLPRWWE